MKKLLTFFITALLAFTATRAADVLDFITITDLGVIGSSYTNFSGITITSDAVYAGQCAKNGNNIQMRATSPSGLVSTISGGKIKRIEISYGGTNTTGRTVDIYGKNTPYESAEDLYSESTRGTYLGTLTYNSSIKYLDISGDYAYIGLKSFTGALYLSFIKITWETGGSTVETCATPTFSPEAGIYDGSQTVTISSTTSGATIYYTTDGNDPTTSSASIANGGTVNIESSCTLKAMAAASGMDNSLVASASYTITHGGNIYRKVTSTNDLVAGKKYILVYESDEKFLGGINTTTNTHYGISVGGPSISNGVVNIAGYSDIRELTLYGSASGWSFHNGEGYLKWSSGNSLDTESTISINSKWTLSGDANSGYSLKNLFNSNRILKYNPNSPRFACYESGQQAVVLYVQESTEPTLTVSTNSLELEQIPFDGSSTSGTFHLTGAHLTGDVSISVSGADGFIVNPNAITPTDGSISQDITVTYSGTSTEPVTATVTITCGGLTQTVTVTAKKATPPAATIAITPASQVINDNAAGELTITGSYVTGNINASLANNSDWYLNPNTFGNTGGTATVTYTGRALSATNTVTATAASDNTVTTQVTVNYQANLYVVGDYGSGWNFTSGEPMTYSDGTYTAHITTQGAAYILFARKLDSNENWNTRNVFGPSSDGNWWLPVSGNGNGKLDLNDDDPIYIQGAGSYIITINVNAGTFTIEGEIVNEGDFVLVTDASQLKDGDEVIFVNRGTVGDGLAMSTTQNNNNRGTTDVTVSPTLKVTATNETQIATLEATDGGWYFNVGDGYLYAASSSNNHLKTAALSTAGDNAKAKIEISSENVASIVFQGSNTRNTMQFNGSLVSCYGSANQSEVYLYRREASAPEPSITVNPSSLDLVIPVGESSVSGTVTVTETNTTGTTSVAVSGTGANYFSATLENGTLTVTYNGNATMTNPDVATITLTNGDATATVNVTGYKRVEATGTLYSKVSNANQIQDGLQYILVYEGDEGESPVAMNNFTNSSYTGGTGTTVAWAEQGSIVNISGTDAIEFTLENGNTEGTYNLYYTSNSESIYLGRYSTNGLDNNETDWYLIKDSNNGGYYLAVGTSSSDYRLRYNTSMSGADKFRLYGNNTGAGVYLYVLGSAVATPVITPGTGNYAEDQEVTISCATTGATIYYTVNGGETQTYDGPFTVDVDEDHTTTTIAAWAEDGEQHHSPTVTVTYTYKKDHVSSIAEFLALDNGEEVIFDNPVVVLFDYSQNSSGGQEYIWIKDRTDYTQLFITPQFDAASVADPQYNSNGNFVPKYENGDVIPAGFKVKKNFYETGQYVQAMCTDTHSTFQEATAKALADPEQVTLSELLANPANYNNRYLYINKLQVSNISGFNFSVSADENGDNVSEVQGGSAIVGYNKYNSPAWKNKNGEVVGVTLPTNSNFYNVKFIFQKWDNGYEIMPIEFTPWQQTSLRLEDLVKVGEEDGEYTISNPLIATKVTWDDNRKAFAIFAKDDEMYASERNPGDLKQYAINYQSQDGSIVNTTFQEDYDQSNWIEILIPNDNNITVKPHDSYQSTLDALKLKYEGKILDGGTIHGYYRDTLNPTIEMSAAPDPGNGTEYSPNIYCTANFLMENLDADGAGSERFFMMDAKPQEFSMVVWAYYPGSGDRFYIPEQVGSQVNGNDFNGSFVADMSLCEDAHVTSETAISSCFNASNKDGNSIDKVKLYGFNAIVRKNPAYWANGANGAPRRADVVPNTAGAETTPAYIVYPLNGSDNAHGTVTDVTEVNVEKTVTSVHYYNVMGMESEQPFDGINIVVTRYSDGTTSAVKVMK